MKTHLSTWMVAIGALAVSTGASANMRSISLGGTYVSAGATASLSLPGSMKIKNIVVQAEGASYQSAMMEVFVNGVAKGTIYVPGTDPSYLVTIAETASSIQFRHTSGGNIRIRDVLANVEGSGNQGNYVDLTPPGLARRAIELVEALEDFTNYKDYGAYLLVIKKQAAKTYAKSVAKGPSAIATLKELEKLKNTIAWASDFIEDNFERDNAFELATELLGLQEKIDEVLN